jgi:hypothetical protein
MKSRQFEPFFDCLTGCDSGVRVISQASQYPEVRIFSMRLLGNPANYSSILRALRRVARSDPTEHTRCRLPSINLCVVNGKFKEILNDPDAGSKLFSSLSETEYNAKICKRILQTDELRRALFDFITKNPEKCMEMFRKIFADFGRRNRCVDIFASPGGTKLLVDLAGDPVGKGMITALSIIPYGIEIGKRLFARNPLMVIKVGKAYLKKPEKE